MIIVGDCKEELKKLKAESVHCCVTSPPYYGLRDYKNSKQIGLEKTPEEYVNNLVEVFREVRRCMRDDGTLWINLGDSYAGSGKGGGSKGSKQQTNTGSLIAGAAVPLGLKAKDLIGIPWMVAFALRADGWYLRQDIIWSKPNPMRESMKDRCTKSHEYIFLLSKSEKYYFDYRSIMVRAVRDDNRQPATSQGAKDLDGRPKEQWNSNKPRVFGAKDNATTNRKGTGNAFVDNGMARKMSVWEVSTGSRLFKHYAQYPHKLIEPCIKAGCPRGGVVLDPFAGTGVTADVAYHHERDYIMIELNPDYAKAIRKRVAHHNSLFNLKESV